MPFTTVALTALAQWATKAALDALVPAAKSWLTITLGKQIGALEVQLGMAPAQNEPSRALAWTMYVQLTTRVAVVEMADDAGFDREALGSLHTLFGAVREALLEAGPEVAVAPRGGGASMGAVASLLLNLYLRPFLGRWHVALTTHERTRGAAAEWPEHQAFRDELAVLQQNLLALARGLEQALDVQGTALLLEP